MNTTATTIIAITGRGSSAKLMRYQRFQRTGNQWIIMPRMNSKNTFIKGKGITKGFYWVENWAELKATLDMLRSGKDPLREKREELANDVGAIFDMLKKGSEKAQAVASQTLDEVKSAMGINYFK